MIKESDSGNDSGSITFGVSVVIVIAVIAFVFLVLVLACFVFLCCVMAGGVGGGGALTKFGLNRKQKGKKTSTVEVGQVQDESGPSEEASLNIDQSSKK